MRTYAIAFDTQEIRGALRVTEISLDTKIVFDKNKKYRVDLCDDPLYPSLVQYVKNNPAGGK